MSVEVLERITTLKTSQSEPATPAQVQNNAGGYTFEVSPEDRIRRFLILGTANGSYYQSAPALTKDNAGVLLSWAQDNTERLVDVIKEISLAGRAPKQDYAIFALAACAGLGNDAGRKYALEALPAVCRTGTALFTFATYVEQFRGWGRGLRRAIGEWYEAKDADKLAYQMTKYRQRGGWSHRDLLRLAHPVGASEAHKALYAWATNNTETDLVELPRTVYGYALATSVTDADSWVKIINDYGLSWEMLPDAALSEPKVWQAMLDNGLPMGALIRQLPRLTNLGVLTGSTLTKVINQLNNHQHLVSARIHPLNMLIAQTTYASGRSVKGKGVWTPNTKIVDAMSDAFYLCFDAIEPADKRTLNAVDISGSMTWQTIKDTRLTDREVAAAMSLVTVATEPDVETVVFSSSANGSGAWKYAGNSRYSAGITPVPLSAKQRLDDAVATINRMPAGGTDCALPMLYAMDKGLEIDHFQIWTDSETWAGAVHPHQALKQYRNASGIPATLAVCATSSNGFSIADPNDRGMIDIVGFDSAVPNLLADFAAGRI